MVCYLVVIAETWCNLSSSRPPPYFSDRWMAPFRGPPPYSDCQTAPLAAEGPPCTHVYRGSSESVHMCTGSPPKAYTCVRGSSESVHMCTGGPPKAYTCVQGVLRMTHPRQRPLATIRSLHTCVQHTWLIPNSVPSGSPPCTHVYKGSFPYTCVQEVLRITHFK